MKSPDSFEIVFMPVELSIDDYAKDRITFRAHQVIT